MHDLCMLTITIEGSGNPDPAFVLVQRIFNYHPIYPTHCLYFGEVETPYKIRDKIYVRFKLTQSYFILL